MVPEEMENAQKIVSAQPERERKLGRPTHNCENGIVTYYMRRQAIKSEEFIHYYKKGYSFSVGCNRYSAFPPRLPLPSPFRSILSSAFS